MLSLLFSNLSHVSKKLTLSLDTSKVKLRLAEQLLRCLMKVNEVTKPCCQMMKMSSMCRYTKDCKWYVYTKSDSKAPIVLVA